MGYDIRTAGSVASALEEFDVEPVELLVADIALPDGTGLDLMRSLRQRDPGGHVRGIALSGYGMEDDIRRCREAGFAKHLTKPIKLDVLEEAIQQVASK
jgi:CheY-like chemotaxis protein